MDEAQPVVQNMSEQTQGEPDRSPAGGIVATPKVQPKPIEPPVQPAIDIPQGAPPSYGTESMMAGEKGQMPPSTWEKTKALAEQVSHGSFVGIAGLIGNDPGWLTRQVEQITQQDQMDRSNMPKSSIQDIKTKYGIDVNEPMDDSVAQMISADRAHQDAVAHWKAQGTPLPGEFFIGAAMGLADPALLATMGTIGAAAKTVGFSSRIAEVGLSTAIRNSFIENAAINAGLGYGAFQQEKKEGTAPSAGEAFQSGAISTLFGMGVHLGIIEPLLHFMKLAPEIMKKLPRDVTENMGKEALAASENNAKPNFQPQLDAAASKLKGDVAGETSPYKFDPVAHPSDRPWYAPKDRQGNVVDHQTLGPGIQMTDDGMKANNMAHPDGEVGQFKIEPGQKFLDIEQPAKSPEFEKLASEVESTTGVKLDIRDGESIKDVLSHLGEMAQSGNAPEDILSQVQELMKKDGVAGYQFVTDENGVRKNGLHLFDESKQPEQRLLPNPELTPEQSLESKQAQNEAHQQVQNAASYDPKIEKDIHANRGGLPANATPDFIDEPTKEMTDFARGKLDKMAEANPKLKEELKAIDDDASLDKAEKKAVQDYFGCMVGE